MLGALYLLLIRIRLALGRDKKGKSSLGKIGKKRPVLVQAGRFALVGRSTSHSR